MKQFSVRAIAKADTKLWLTEFHYAKRMPPISYAFGLYEGAILQGVLTIGKPHSPSLWDGICGREFAEYVFELNRLCVADNLPKNTLSFFVGQVLRMLRQTDMILVSYADTSQGHHGYIYQATNWVYTGLSAIRSEWREVGSDKHSRTLVAQVALEDRHNSDRFELIDRPRKHRYVYFLGRKKKAFAKSLKYERHPYPKGDNRRYETKPVTETQLALFAEL